ncbi:hypothetical protein JKJ11_01015 [Vibrio sp. SCSIO 43133]|nr:hypothetical protein [Vibrio sp. SCSIO 43133]USE00702.1 hypothetical protein JKJ11_01015 [Vibrio sp. SCSIO 43133]
MKASITKRIEQLEQLPERKETVDEIYLASPDGDKVLYWKREDSKHDDKE